MFGKFVLYFVFLISLSGFANSQTPSEVISSNSISTQLQITGRPQPSYTDSARQKKVKGNVYLRVTFLASGEIGDVVYIKESSKKKKLTKYGLVNQAIIAAKKIKFKPAIKDGTPVSVERTVVYTFTIY